MAPCLTVRRVVTATLVGATEAHTVRSKPAPAASVKEATNGTRSRSPSLLAAPVEQVHLVKPRIQNSLDLRRAPVRRHTRDLPYSLRRLVFDPCARLAWQDPKPEQGGEPAPATLREIQNLASRASHSTEDLTTSRGASRKMPPCPDMAMSEVPVQTFAPQTCSLWAFLPPSPSCQPEPHDGRQPRPQQHVPAAN